MPEPEGAPLRSDAPAEEESEPAPSLDTESADAAPPAAARPAPPTMQFRFSTFVLAFLFILGIWMLFDTSMRLAVAQLLDLALYPTIGFAGQYPLLTMFLAACIEMLATAVAYNYTTDWIKTAKVQSWSKALRPVQMAAIRSGKKDRIAAIKPHQDRLTRLSGEVSIAQLKGMAVTWFLVIAVYTWVGLFLTHDPLSAAVNLGGATINLTGMLGPIPWWFLIFSLYTVPASIVFRRALKHYALRRYAARQPPAPTPDSGAAGGAA